MRIILLVDGFLYRVQVIQCNRPDNWKAALSPLLVLPSIHCPYAGESPSSANLAHTSLFLVPLTQRHCTTYACLSSLHDVSTVNTSLSSSIDDESILPVCVYLSRPCRCIPSLDHPTLARREITPGPLGQSDDAIASLRHGRRIQDGELKLNWIFAPPAQGASLRPWPVTQTWSKNWSIGLDLMHIIALLCLDSGICPSRSYSISGRAVWLTGGVGGAGLFLRRPHYRRRATLVHTECAPKVRFIGNKYTRQTQSSCCSGRYPWIAYLVLFEYFGESINAL